MKTVYHLQHDSNAIASMQRASLDSGPIGLRVTHGLIGSTEWWSQIESGALVLQVIRGKISGFWPGQWGAGPAEFELQTKDGEKSHWLCELESIPAQKEFHIGRSVEVAFVVQELKSVLEGRRNETKITVSVSLA